MLSPFFSYIIRSLPFWSHPPSLIWWGNKKHSIEFYTLLVLGIKNSSQSLYTVFLLIFRNVGIHFQLYWNTYKHIFTHTFTMNIKLLANAFAYAKLIYVNLKTSSNRRENLRNLQTYEITLWTLWTVMLPKPKKNILKKVKSRDKIVIFKVRSPHFHHWFNGSFKLRICDDFWLAALMICTNFLQ